MSDEEIKIEETTQTEIEPALSEVPAETIPIEEPEPVEEAQEKSEPEPESEISKEEIIKIEEPAETSEPIELPEPEEEKIVEEKTVEVKHTEEKQAPVEEPEPKLKEEPTIQKEETATPKEEPVDKNGMTPTVRTYLMGLLVKANAAVQTKKQKNLKKLLTLFDTMPKVQNNDVEKFLHLKDAMATRYLNMLLKEGKIRREGTGSATRYYKL